MSTGPSRSELPLDSVVDEITGGRGDAGVKFAFDQLQLARARNLHLAAEADRIRNDNNQLRVELSQAKELLESLRSELVGTRSTLLIESRKVEHARRKLAEVRGKLDDKQGQLKRIRESVAFRVLRKLSTIIPRQTK